MQPTSRLFRLGQTAKQPGLICDETGLALAGVPLLRKAEMGFEPRAAEEIDLLLRGAGLGDDQTQALPHSGLKTVAEALNRGDLVKAQMAALFLRVPTFDEAAAARLKQADEALAKAGFNPAQPRDKDGCWTAGGTHRYEPGRLHEAFEAKGPKVISTGKGDKGGVSFGWYQITHHWIPNFLQTEGAKWPELRGMPPTSPAFATAWNAVVDKDGKAFDDAQHAYVNRNDYQPALKYIHRATGVDISNHSDALQEAVWSTADQHGPRPASEIVGVAIHSAEAKGLKPADLGFDSAVINGIYDERGRKNADGTMAYFTGSSKDVGRGVADRYPEERKRRLKQLASQKC